MLLFPKSTPLWGYPHQSANAASFPQGKPLVLGVCFVRTNSVFAMSKSTKIAIAHGTHISKASLGGSWRR